jgi:hypothetical protein
MSSSCTNRFRPHIEFFEERDLPASTITAAFGAGPSGGPEVTVLFDDGSQFHFFAFDAGFYGGVSATIGMVNGAGVPDVIVGAGRGGGPEVKVFDGAQLLAGHVVTTAAFMAFPTDFHGGVSLAVGAVNGTGHQDVIVGAGPGGGPEVEVVDGSQLAMGRAVVTAAFFAFPVGFTGGVTLATGHVNGTNHADVVVGAGHGGGPEVEVFDGAQLAQGKPMATAAFFAFPADFTGGVSVAVGPVNGTSHEDVVVGAGPGGGPEVEVYDGAQLAQGQLVTTAAFFAFPLGFVGGVSAAVARVSCTGHADVVVSAGPGGGPEVEVYDGAQLAQGKVVPASAFMAFPTYFHGGVQVVIAHLPGCHDEVILVAGPGGGPQVNVYDCAALLAGDYYPLDSFFAFAPDFIGGVDLGIDFGDCVIGDFYAAPPEPNILPDIYDPGLPPPDNGFVNDSGGGPTFDYGGFDGGFGDGFDSGFGGDSGGDGGDGGC